MIPDEIIKQAFQQFDRFYAKRPTNPWSVADHACLWALGQRAFAGSGDRHACRRIYEELRRRWQVFRSPTPMPAPTSDRIFDILSRVGHLAPRFKTLRLADLSMQDVPLLRQALGVAGNIKRHNDGRPSMVAVSKFLHFWNPRLFVIVDNAEMAQKVIKAGVIIKDGSSLQSIRKRIQDTQRRIEQCYGASTPQDEPMAEGLSYSAVLIWASQLIQGSPNLLSHFKDYVDSQTKEDGVPDGYEEYAAVAVEWFLLGLQHLCNTTQD